MYSYRSRKRASDTSPVEVRTWMHSKKPLWKSAASRGRMLYPSGRAEVTSVAMRLGEKSPFEFEAAIVKGPTWMRSTARWWLKSFRRKSAVALTTSSFFESDSS